MLADGGFCTFKARMMTVYKINLRNFEVAGEKKKLPSRAAFDWCADAVGLAVFFPFFVAIAMSVAGFIGFAVRVIFPFVVFALVLPAVFPALFIVLIGVETVFVLIMMVLRNGFLMALLRYCRGNCPETTNCHNERERS
jgi:hypothetical protein